jgi:hypothetical protein
MALFLAAITALLLSWVLGAPKAPLGTIVAKRGEAGTGAGAAVGGWDVVGGTAVGTITAAASALTRP